MANPKQFAYKISKLLNKTIPKIITLPNIDKRALEEFDNFVKVIRSNKRKSQTLKTFKEHFSSHKVIDLTGWENKNKFLQCAGNFILDHINQNI